MAPHPLAQAGVLGYFETSLEAAVCFARHVLAREADGPAAASGAAASAAGEIEGEMVEGDLEGEIEGEIEGEMVEVPMVEVPMVEVPMVAPIGEDDPADGEMGLGPSGGEAPLGAPPELQLAVHAS